MLQVFTTACSRARTLAVPSGLSSQQTAKALNLCSGAILAGLRTRSPGLQSPGLAHSKLAVSPVGTAENCPKT